MKPLHGVVETGAAADLERFVEGYEKLQQTLKKSLESEAKFMARCKLLAKQIQSHLSKLAALQADQNADQEKLNQLRQA